MADHGQLSAQIYEAKSSGKAELHGSLGEWTVRYSGSCERPLLIKRSADRGALFATFEVRCRQCSACLRARTGFWAYAASNNARRVEAEGRRTWFGTLTLAPEYQAALRDSALQAWHTETGATVAADWWDDAMCEERFKRVRNVLLREIQLYWKRLRKAGHKFSYIAVFERHISGLPHVHFLLHEEQSAITKAELQKQWNLGFTNVKLVGGRRKARSGRKGRLLTVDYCAWYVAKYLSKSSQSRQLASLRYSSPRPCAGVRAEVTNARDD